MTSLKSSFLRAFLFISLLPTFAGMHFGRAGYHVLSPDRYAINPNVTWNTFLGQNNGTDYGLAIVLDTSRNIYVTGISNEAWGTPVRNYTGASDAFVAKLDAGGNLMWNTFLGGSSSNDYGEEIFVDPSGNIYVTGLTDASTASGSGNGTWGNPVRPFMGRTDAFVAKLDSSGNLIWNTFLGSIVSDWGKGLVVTQDGSIYVTGFSDAAWGDQIVRPFTAIVDTFVAKLDSDGNLAWTSFLGGIGFDQGNGITSAENGNLYIAGFSTATAVSATWGNPVRDYIGGGDAFVANVDTSGNLMWNTFLGGNGYDHATEAAVDRTGKVYVTGFSDSLWGSPIRGYTAAIDAFAALLDSNGNLSWNTYLGGSGFDFGYGLDVDGEGNAFITGYSNATWGNPVHPYIALDDGFEANLDPGGNLVSNSFLGGSGYDYGFGLDVDEAGNTYVTGSSTATWGTPVDDYSPPTDAFVTLLDFPPLVVSTSLKSVMNHGRSNFTITFSEDVNNPIGSTGIDDATNPNNYLLIDKGLNGSVDTTSCAGGITNDDKRIIVTGVTYNATTYTSTVNLTEALPAGKYRLLVCGTTSIIDLANNALAGNGTTSGTDYIFDFTVNSTASTGSLPDTGFAPRVVTTLPLQPVGQAYLSLGDVWLEIPSQNVRSNIVGVPQSGPEWDVTWLGDNIGWLHDTAFPSWTGNSVLTGHVYSSNGLPGPFINIKDLRYGDTIIAHVYGQKYIFEVQSTRLVSSSSKEFALQHLESRSYLTLITCQGYNPLNDSRSAGVYRSGIIWRFCSKS
jgi:LPXTG-site transpeptidase (sortase) family protein